MAYDCFKASLKRDACFERHEARDQEILMDLPLVAKGLIAFSPPLNANRLLPSFPTTASATFLSWRTRRGVFATDLPPHHALGNALKTV